MRASRTALLLILLGTCLVSAAMAAGEGVPLALKFAEGDSVTYQVMFSGAGRLLDSQAQTSPVVIQGTATVTQSVASVQPDGTAVLETLLPQADVTISIKDHKARFTYADGQIQWSADGQEKAPPQADLSKVPLLKSPVRVTMRSDGAVTDIAFADAAIMDLLRKAVPALGTSLPISNSSPVFPAEPVRVGESWTREQQVPFGEGQTASVRARRTLESLTGSGGLEMAKISGYGEMKLRTGNQSITGPQGQQFSFAIPEMKQTVTSTEFFNVGAGRLVRADYDTMFTTKLSFGMGGASQSGSIEVRFRGTVVCR